MPDAVQGDAAAVEEAHLPNGLTLILKENHSTPIVAFTAYVRGGSAAEDGTNRGIANYVQRMLMKGTPSRTAERTALDLEFLGSRMSPFTGKDVSGATMSCLSRHFEPALAVFADCLLCAAMPEIEVDRERHVIVQEIRQKRDDPLAYCLELCEGALFQQHPYAFAISGAEDVVGRLTAPALREWHARFNRPEQMAIAVVGDFHAARAREMLSAAFGGIASSDGRVWGTDAPAPLQAITERVEICEKRQAAIALGFQAPPFGVDDFYAFDVLEHVLSGMGSRLFIELRDKQGLGYIVNCQYDARRLAGGFKIYMSTSEDRCDRARQSMLVQLVRLRDEAVSDEELARTKQYMMGLFEIAMQRHAAQASRLAYYAIMGLSWRLLDEYPRRIQRVTSEEVMSAARRYIDLDAYAVAQIVPHGK